MSKEIAQTVGGKRIAWLIAIVAAFAVMATLGTQWQKSEAALPTAAVTLTGGGSTTPGGAVAYTATFTFNPSGSVAAGGAGTFSVDFDDDLVYVSTTGTGIAAIDTADCSNSGATNVLTCVDDGGEFWTDGTLIFNFTNPLAGGTISVAGTCTLTDVTSVSCTNSTAGATVANAVQVTPETATNAMGVAEVYSFALPAGYTCASDDADDATRTCAIGDVNVSAGLTVVSGPTVADSVLANASAVTVTVINSSTSSTGGTVSLDVSTSDDGGTDFISEVGTKTYVEAELRHIADDASVITGQEINSNVRGSRHTICTVAEGTSNAIQIPGLTLANIVITNGGGYASTIDTDPDFTDVRIFVGTGNTDNATEGLSGATCISWVSTDAGDQQINIVYVGADGQNYNVSWDNDGAGNRSLIKEWNRLDDSLLTIEGTAQTDAAGDALQEVVKTYGVVLNPATGKYQFTGTQNPIDILDIFRGSHTNSAGVREEDISLVGVDWTISVAGCDADITGATSGTTYLTGAGATAGYPDIDVRPGDCLPGESLWIYFSGSEPGPLGSGTGNEVEEIVIITFVQNIAEKQVFLAWAGQRIILEHDWRLAPGDGAATDEGPVPNGTCPFSGQGYFYVQYIKGTGPGNFVAGLSANISGADEAVVMVGTSDNSQSLESNIATSNDDDDINNEPQDNCISRVLYESEDPGEVDIEAFAYAGCEGPGCDDENYTKVAFVVYYMKINTINVSLVTQVSKPSHNSSWYADYAPGNPWDASKDDADNAADWNVSKDLLVRGRVTGWFTNSNPSGRAADTSNPLNVLPANRWVMPQDWPLLAGGPGDPADGSDATGTAEQFRPYYDIMFAPNNTRGLSLLTPEGTGYTVLTYVATGNTGVGSLAAPIRVASCSDLPAGRAIFIGASFVARTVSLCSSGFLFLNSSLTSVPAAGTLIMYASAAPFEGPFSLLDIVGLAAEGKGGAALSNYVPGSIRDTANDDGDVDMWDAPMPPAPVSVAIRGTGFIKEVYKSDVYYLGTPNSVAQVYPNPYYIENIPGSPFIPAVVAGGGYLWNSWANDGPGGDGQGVYRYWEAVFVATNSEGFGEIAYTSTSTDGRELNLIRNYYEDWTIARDLVVFSDNHGEFMVTANGDFKTDLTACTTNVLAGGKHCKTGDKVGTGTITATVDYPDFRGKHFPVLSNAATVTWLWGGYKDVTVEAGETDQYKYIVFHAMDRDGFCTDTTGLDAILLHSVLSESDSSSTLYESFDDGDTAFTIANMTGSAPSNARHNNDPIENVDFLIDSGEGIIIGSSDPYATINDGKQFATDVWTFSTLENNPSVTGIKEFPFSSLAATGATDECQAWIKVSNSLLGILNVLAIANDDEGNIGFDKIIDLTNTTSYTLNFRWSLVTWAGADAISVSDAIKGTGTSGKNPGGNDISASVTAIYGWDAAAQQWLGYFPSGVNVPGANDLVSLKTGSAFWIAITGPSSVTWTIASNVN